MTLRRIVMAVLTTVAIGALSACGRKGPLYLPTPPAETPQSNDKPVDSNNEKTG